VAYGFTAGTVALGNDARLSDARTPLAHGRRITMTQPDPALTPDDVDEEAESTEDQPVADEPPEG